MIRVLIVDDSPTVAYLLRSILQSDPAVRVVGEARTGEDGVAQCQQLQPDLVTMDVEMPGMGGLEAIRQIMDVSPRPIVVVTAVEARRLMTVSFQALELGALAVEAKPTARDGAEAERLLVLVKTMAGVKVVRRFQRRPAPVSAPSAPPPAAPAAAAPVRLVAVGVSTGGPQTLQIILAGLPASFPAPIIVVQHISPGFVDGLASWITDTTPLPCHVAAQNEPLQAGHVYLAPDNHHLLVPAPGVIHLDTAPPVGGHRPSANPLFESVAYTYGAAAVGVLLTGMGEDGARGLRTLRRAGALTIVQDEATSVIFGMPRAAIELGAAVQVLALDKIAGQLVAQAGRG